MTLIVVPVVITTMFDVIVIILWATIKDKINEPIPQGSQVVYGPHVAKYDSTDLFANMTKNAVISKNGQQ